jgi:hypothetical protein
LDVSSVFSHYRKHLWRFKQIPWRSGGFPR